MPEIGMPAPIRRPSPCCGAWICSSATATRLGGSSGRDGRRPALVPGRAGDALIMSDLSEPGPEPADALLDDREWLAAHHFEPLGRLDVPGGGMGFIALAWHTGMKREVVLKVASKESNERRFHREIQVHARLGGHTNIAVTRTPLRYRKASVLVVQLRPGSEFPEAGPVARPDVVAGVVRLHPPGRGGPEPRASPGDHAPRRQVVEPRPILAGWRGQGDRLGARSRPPGPGRGPHRHRPVPGHARLLPPEQAVRPSDATPASDLYGLGCVWYELLSGSPPFHGNQAQLATAHRGEPVPALPPGWASPTPSSSS